MTNYGAIIRQALEDNNMKIKDLLEATSISRSNLWNIMKGNYSPREETWAKISRALNLKEFRPPKNDYQSYSRKIKDHMNSEKTVSIELLKDISDVQHGRKEAVDYSKYTPKQIIEVKPVEVPDVKPHITDKLLIDLFLKTAGADPADIFHDYGLAVLRLINDRS